MKKIVEEKKNTEQNTIKEVSFVEKELLLNSLTQRELLSTTKDLNKTIKELTETLHLIEKHEYLSLHKSTWKLIAYNIMLGMLFAIGTVLGFLVLSWLTFNFFKDSIILNQFVQNQLKSRQFDIGIIKEKAKSEIEKTDTGTGKTTQSGSTKE